jgi:hypothetical protein
MWAIAEHLASPEPAQRNANCCVSQTTRMKGEGGFLSCFTEMVAEVVLTYVY